MINTRSGQGKTIFLFAKETMGKMLFRMCSHNVFEALLRRYRGDQDYFVARV